MKTIQIKKLIEKIEGEADLDFTIKDNVVKDVKIEFSFSRGIEEILKARHYKDALVITPKVCGICNHAHLLASVKAIENGYKNEGVKVELSSKAKDIRNFTLNCELIQNHIKWLYMIILPQLEKYLKQNINKENYTKATNLSSKIIQALAIFAGQWPHSSYAIPGGITCDPSYVDVMQAQGLLNESIKFFETNVVGLPLDEYLAIDSVSNINNIKGDLANVIKLLIDNGMADIGISYDKFIVFSDDGFAKSGKSIKTNIFNVDSKYVKESNQINTLAKSVMYKNQFYEVGPLSRAMMNKTKIIKSLHKSHKDSVLTRIFARVNEVAILLEQCNSILNNLKLNEDSCTIDKKIKLDNFQGTGIVEAARGSLIHKTTIQKGLISNYEIITPTQWNLSNGSCERKGIAVNAMIGSQSMQEAIFILRTFDVCSVCTTQ